MAATKLTAGKLRVRMYRVGFGDCFLLSVPNGKGHSHILIDCGVHSGGDIKTMPDVVADIASETGSKLDVVIMSHAHRDHISGFASEAEAWKAFEVSEVWMPWLEDKSDPQARKLADKRKALAAMLQMHFAAAPEPVAQEIVENATGIPFGAAAAAKPNEIALDLLRSGFRSKAEVSYLRAGEEFTNVADIKGLTARILAPSDDTTFLGKLDPPVDQRFLRMGENGPADENAIRPIPQRWIVEGRKFPKDFTPLAATEEKEVRKFVSTPLSALALTLDRALNNTSLVVLFEYGDEVLLFPGDAQWGNWKSWIQEDASLLERVTFYKVGHHGSVNATPKNALLGMKSLTAAMASTQSKPFPSIPEQKLVDALNGQTKKQYVQSDSINIAGAPNVQITGVPKRFKKGRLWYDYIVG